MVLQLRPTSRALMMVFAIWTTGSPMLLAADYFLTIGGGYNPTGNQASLEANVIFFQQILDEKHRGSRNHDIFFSDGNDPIADLQVLATKPRQNPVIELLENLHRRRGEEQLEYRNHRVPDIAGGLDPALVHTRLKAIAKKAQPGDRLIVYVTAHGSEGPKPDSFNTTIDCWNEQRITAREFTRWLSELPPTVPVVMVMAQCYCGGFGHTIFQELDEKKGLASQMRAGFFAQRHDLPAAGCRPDIHNDEEFSSYFWGAIVGRSRTGVPVTGCDINGDGSVSFAEAYAHAVVAGNTIDIPLRTSDVLLRTYSRMSLAEIKKPAAPVESNSQLDTKSEPEAKPDVTDDRPPPKPPVLGGTLQSFVDQGRPVSARIVIGLSKGLGFSLQDDVSVVIAAYESHRKSQKRGPGPGGGRRRSGSGRRELLQEIAEKWPELADPKHWEESPLLKPDNQEQLLADLKQLRTWKGYDQRRQQAAESEKKAEEHELREVKFRRLISTLEAIQLEKHLSQVATPEIVERYRQLIQLEESSLNSES
ncbi:MAG: hypothetical protein WCJ09_17985 [Planctomycetota bacterium]